jgi:hypothetical protein
VPRAAAMYALQATPGLKNTDRAFCQGQRRKMENMGSLVSGMLHKRAQQAGINTAGKYYMSGIGKATDPAAWVSSAEDVMTVAKARNLNLEGVLNRKAIQKDLPPPPKPVVAPDIVNKLARKAVANNPALRERCQKNKHAIRELKESIVEKHRHQKRPKPIFTT